MKFQSSLDGFSHSCYQLATCSCCGSCGCPVTGLLRPWCNPLVQFFVRIWDNKKQLLWLCFCFSCMWKTLMYKRVFQKQPFLKRAVAGEVLLFYEWFIAWDNHFICMRSSCRQARKQLFYILPLLMCPLSFLSQQRRADHIFSSFVTAEKLKTMIMFSLHELKKVAKRHANEREKSFWYCAKLFCFKLGSCTEGRKQWFRDKSGGGTFLKMLLLLFLSHSNQGEFAAEGWSSTLCFTHDIPKQYQDKAIPSGLI